MLAGTSRDQCEDDMFGRVMTLKRHRSYSSIGLYVAPRRRVKGTTNIRKDSIHNTNKESSVANSTKSTDKPSPIHIYPSSTSGPLFEVPVTLTSLTSMHDHSMEWFLTHHGASITSGNSEGCYYIAKESVIGSSLTSCSATSTKSKSSRILYVTMSGIFDIIREISHSCGSSKHIEHHLLSHLFERSVGGKYSINNQKDFPSIFTEKHFYKTELSAVSSEFVGTRNKNKKRCEVRFPIPFHPLFSSLISTNDNSYMISLKSPRHGHQPNHLSSRRRDTNSRKSTRDIPVIYLLVLRALAHIQESILGSVDDYWTKDGFGERNKACVVALRVTCTCNKKNVDTSCNFNDDLKGRHNNNNTSAKRSVSDDISSLGCSLTPMIDLVGISVCSELKSAQRAHVTSLDFVSDSYNNTSLKHGLGSMDSSMGCERMAEISSQQRDIEAWSRAPVMLGDTRCRGRICGVHLVWTHSSMRGCGMASRLIDYCRRELVAPAKSRPALIGDILNSLTCYNTTVIGRREHSKGDRSIQGGTVVSPDIGYHEAYRRLYTRIDSEIPRQQVAFSHPTQNGKLLAYRYVKRKDFLVFT